MKTNYYFLLIIFLTIIVNSSCNKYKTCNNCNGNGSIKTKEDCYNCKGRGTVMCDYEDYAKYSGIMAFFVNSDKHYYHCRNGKLYADKSDIAEINGQICPQCNGTGKIDCSVCSGYGYIERTKTCETCNGSGEVLTSYGDFVENIGFNSYVNHCNNSWGKILFRGLLIIVLFSFLTYFIEDVWGGSEKIGSIVFGVAFITAFYIIISLITAIIF